ncbi:thiamine-phosphate kinase [bacterium]|nr:thiamine-phosphate kinase [bacterium]
MKEKDLISVIKNTLNSNYIGDDCAYLKDLDIVITQDSLVEGVHFSLDFITPYQLGYKSVMVNISDISASGAEPKYLTIALSMPKKVTDKNFVEEFYKGAKSACPNGVEIVGGDITGADKVFISVCAIGKTQGRNISSRSNAKIGYKVVVKGEHGTSGAGLKLLLNREKSENKFTKAHLMPKAQVEFGRQIGESVKEEYAMMDTSDGLMDALSTIANNSGVLLDIDFDKVPIDNDIKQFSNWKELVLFGGEDYGIVAVIPARYHTDGTVIGTVKEGLGVDLKIDCNSFHYSQKDVEEKIFNHFTNGD